MNDNARSVVVGVDGTDANLGALRYAVSEVRRTGGQLELVHVVPDYVAISPLLPEGPGDLGDIGIHVLRQAEKEVHALAPDMEPISRLCHGSRVAELIDAAARADLLVVGRDGRSVVHRLVDGDTATRAASRAPVPVVEVPPHWHEDPGGQSEHRVVLVGMKSAAHAPALGAAFALARQRAAKLVVLHAWHLPSAYDDIIESRIARERVEAEGIAEIQRLTREWRFAYPEVRVEPRVVHDRPAHALVAASRSALLLVLVRRAHGVPPVGHLGGTARAVLHSAECPVMVLPPSHVPEAPPLVLESHGDLIK